MNAQELLDKYIKYNSKITFDIFKLMYQTLIDLGFTSPHNVEESFKEFSGNYPYFVMKLYNDMPYFNQYTNNLIEQSEISVEDLLGYNPFESFTLPEKWRIKVQEMKNTPEEIVNWRLKIVMCGPWTTPGYLYNDGYHRTKIDQEYIEITLEQFKQYVLKEPIMTKSSKPFPTHWCIELNKETIPIVGVYYNKKHLSDPTCDTYTGYGAIGCYVKSHNGQNEYIKNGYTSCSFYGEPSDSYPEITLEQFKEFVMNEPVKIETISESKVEENVPEYVECFYSDTDAFIINKIYKCEPLSSPDNLSLNSERGLKKSLPYEGSLWKFKSSTKEAFEAQNKPKSIEKWSVGSYIVPLQDRLLTRDEPLIKGKPYQITKRSSVPYIMCEKGMEINFCDDSYTEITEGIKWFATLTEAEEFAKTLVKSGENNIERKEGTDEVIIDKPKQVLKQAVHCKTQEEWNFACDKYDKPSSTKKDFPTDNTFNYTGKFYGWNNLEYYITNGYQIISFQEWCDLNGYKMKKTRFQAGDYVVSLRPESLSTSSIKHNYCYIQDKDDNNISIGGATMYEEDPHYARLATPEEIGEYNRIGKPYDVTTLQPKTINTYCLNIGDKLDARIIAAWEKKGFNYFSDSKEGWVFGNGLAYDKNRKIESFKIIDGVVGFLISGTLNIYLRAEGFKEFSDNYYTENISNFKVGSWYKYNGYYLKYSKISNKNLFTASEYIDTRDNEFKDKLTNFTCGIADGSKELVTNLSVIQQYLPEGHPDLVNTVNKEVKDISKTSTIRVTSREVKRIKI